MRRREFITMLGGAAAAWPLAARGQAARKRPLVGWFGGSSQHEQVAMRNRDAFVQGLREHGYEDGKNVDIVYRWADGDISRFPELATELVALDPAVVVSAANTGTIALRQATSTRIHLTRHTAIDGQHMTTRRRQQPLNSKRHFERGDFLSRLIGTRRSRAHRQDNRRGAFRRA
jgi:ABC-type uncharacterized transport system substrate-binding protein